MANEEDISERFQDLQISLELEGTKLYRGDTCLGTGVLKINENELCWKCADECVVLTYPEISLHAVSRDASSFTHPCVFMLCTLTAEDDVSDNDECPPQTEFRLVLEDNDKLDAVFDAISECQSLHPDPDLSTDSEQEEEGEYPVITNEEGDDPVITNEEEDDPVITNEEGDAPAVVEDVQAISEDSGFYRTVEDLQYLSPEGQRTLEHLERVLAASENGTGTDGQFDDAD